MFVIELTYKVPLTDIDAHMRDHVAFLERHYSAGHFLVSGRQVPRVGGIIIAIAPSREAIETIVREDPFCTRGLADFRVIEFNPSQRGDALDERVTADARRIRGARRINCGTDTPTGR